MSVSVKGGGGVGISSSDVTASKAQVLSGYTAVTSDSNDEAVSGTMVNNGAITTTVGVGGSYTIPEGFHNGSGKISGATLSGDAAVANVLSGKTFYSNSGTKQTGTMTNRGAVSQTLGINGSYTIPAGYHNGSGKVSQSITTKAAATYTPTTSNQTISAGQYLSGAQTIKGDSNLVAANILKGKSIFGVNGSIQKYAFTNLSSALSTTAKTFSESSSSTRSAYYAYKTNLGFTPIAAGCAARSATYYWFNSYASGGNIYVRYMVGSAADYGQYYINVAFTSSSVEIPIIGNSSFSGMTINASGIAGYY